MHTQELSKEHFLKLKNQALTGKESDDNIRAENADVYRIKSGTMRKPKEDQKMPKFSMPNIDRIIPGPQEPPAIGSPASDSLAGLTSTQLLGDDKKTKAAHLQEPTVRIGEPTINYNGSNQDPNHEMFGRFQLKA